MLNQYLTLRLHAPAPHGPELVATNVGANGVAERVVVLVEASVSLFEFVPFRQMNRCACGLAECACELERAPLIRTGLLVN